MLRQVLLPALLLPFAILAQTHIALDFDGVDDRVDCGAASALDITGAQITLEAWIYPTSWKPEVYEGTIISKDGGILSFAGYMLRAGADGQLDFVFGDGAAWRAVVSPASSMVLNTWYHVAGSYDGTNARLYINGNLVGTSAVTTPIVSTPSELVLGNWSGGTGRNFPGIMDEVRIWDIALGQTTISNMQHASYCGDEAGLVAYYRFDQGVGGGNNTSITTLDDLIGNADGALSGFALNGNASNFVGGTIPGTPVSDTICPNEIYVFNGGSYTGPGTYTVTIPTGASCDSTVVLTLTETAVNTGVVQNANILIAQANGAAYQWINCATNLPIPGATNQYYTAFTVGEYAVIVTHNGCSDTSACYDVTTIGMEDRTMPDARIWPQPVADLLNIEMSAPLASAEVRIADLTGRVVHQRSFAALYRATIDVEALPSGVFFLEIESGGARQALRFVRE